MRRIFLAVCVSMAIVSCHHGVSIRYFALRQAAPNPFHNAREFAVAPIRFDGAVAGTGRIEETIGQGGDPASMAYLNQLEQGMNQLFVAQLVARSPLHITEAHGPPPTGTFVVQPQLIGVDLSSLVMTGGFGDRPVGSLAAADFALRIFSSDGTLLDDIRIHFGTRSVGTLDDYFEDVGRDLGNRVTAYLAERTGVPVTR